MPQPNLVTKEGLGEAQRELDERKTTIRTQIANEIERAREQGDLSENAAYKAAIEQNQFNEKKILDLEDFIKNAQIIEEESNKAKIGIGTKVEVVNKATGQKVVYEIVGQNEADPTKGKISNLSPLGEAMIGKKVNQNFELATPSGEKISYTVVKIN